jgi:drug/metabolite transporter (DMT)-like permease
VASRRFGYALGIAINVLFIFFINEWPGWQQVPFLTDATNDVLPLVNASLVISAVVNAVYLIGDPRWLRALGDAFTAAVSFAVILVVLMVFPFDFSAYSFDWAMLVTVMMWVGLVGSAVAVVANLVTMVRELGGIEAEQRQQHPDG